MFTLMRNIRTFFLLYLFTRGRWVFQKSQSSVYVNIECPHRVHRLQLLAEIKGNKVYFGKLVTFWGEGGVNLPPTYPLDPLKGVSRG